MTRSRGGEDVRRRESQRGLEGLSQVLLILLVLPIIILTVQSQNIPFTYMLHLQYANGNR